jgi:hypothetical protein
MRGLLAATTVFCLMTGVAVAQNGTLVVTPDQVMWGPAPVLPADWQAAILIGAPRRAASAPNQLAKMVVDLATGTLQLNRMVTANREADDPQRKWSRPLPDENCGMANFT